MPNLPCMGGQRSEINSIQLVPTWYSSKDAKWARRISWLVFIRRACGMHIFSPHKQSKGEGFWAGNPERHRNLASLLAHISSGRRFHLHRPIRPGAVSANLQCASDPQEVSYRPPASRLTDCTSRPLVPIGSRFAFDYALPCPAVSPRCRQRSCPNEWDCIYARGTVFGAFLL